MRALIESHNVPHPVATRMRTTTNNHNHNLPRQPRQQQDRSSNGSVQPTPFSFLRPTSRANSTGTRHYELREGESLILNAVLQLQKRCNARWGSRGLLLFLFCVSPHTSHDLTIIFLSLGLPPLSTIDSCSPQVKLYDSGGTFKGRSGLRGKTAVAALVWKDQLLPVLPLKGLEMPSNRQQYKPLEPIKPIKNTCKIKNL